MAKLIDYPDGLPDGALSVVADFLRGKGDKAVAAHNAWHAQGYFQGMFLGNYTPPQIVGSPSPHFQAAQSVRSMTREEQADFLERAGEERPEVVGASGVAMGNQGFNLLQIIAILRQVMEMLFPHNNSSGEWDRPSQPRPMGQEAPGSMFSASQPQAGGDPRYGGNPTTPPGVRTASTDEQGRPRGSVPPGPANNPATAGVDKEGPQESGPPERGRREPYVPPSQRAGQDAAQAQAETPKADAKGTATGRRQTGNAG